MNGELVFYVNGKRVVDAKPDPELTLLRYLREKLRLCGTKLGCAEGGCGACTVMISKYDRSTKTVKHLAVNACLTPICSVHGLAVTTVEGIGSTKTRLHPVQERIAKSHGSQCGFCTPGIVMSMYALLRSTPKPNMKDLEVAFQGNLCRCTGYRPIIEGYRTFTEEYSCGMGEKCCKKTGNICGKEGDEKLFEPNEFTPYDPSQEPIFPAELKLNDQLDCETLRFENEKGVTWFRPTLLTELLDFKNRFPESKIVVGNTEVGVEVKFKRFDYKYLISPNQVDELNRIEYTNKGIRVGSAVTLIELQNALQTQIDQRSEFETRLYRAIVDMLHWFAGKQIRNVASVGGNIMTGSPISDLIPIFTAAAIELDVVSINEGRRKVVMGEGFFTGYRKNIIKGNEILVSIFIPVTVKNQFFVALKQAKRRDDDIAIVNGAFNIKFKEGTNVIEEIQIAYGGMAPTVVLAAETSYKLKGMTWNRDLIEIANESLINEIPLSDNAPGGMILYRRSLTLSLFFKTFLIVSQQLEPLDNIRIISEREKSGSLNFHTLTPKSTQFFEKVSDIQPDIDPIRRPKIHSSALKHATGEAVYCDDVPKYENELYLALVLSTKAHAKILSIDPSEALEQDGVHAFFSAKDLSRDQNSMGPLVDDEEMFVSETVMSQGQILGAIAAETQVIAQRAARFVKVLYKELDPIIVTIEDAIKHKSFFPGYPKILNSGDIERSFKEADFTVSGEIRLGGQEHFYLETNSAIAIPKDSDELEIISSTQQPSEIQRRAAKLLQISENRVICRTKRLGGGFGGKETRSALISLPVSFAAFKLGRPVRLMLDRDEDMMITGSRNPFLFMYKISFKKDGTITGCKVEAFNNAGYSIDFSGLVMEKAQYQFTNSYNFKNVQFKQTVLRSNIASNTAFRGFGGPQGMMVGEHIVRDVARVLGKDYLEIMKINMYKDGDLTHYNQKLMNCNISKCFIEVQNSSEFAKRREDVKKFNAENRWKKRGISLVNTMFGIAFTEKFMNQGGALVHVYLDGSVLISHGGVEMGQGLHIKMMQVASKALQIPIEKIHIQETATDKVPNASSTAASVGSDLNGGAVLDACEAIYERLKPYRDQYTGEGWDKWVQKAYFDRVSLSATGFYATPDIGYNPVTNSVNVFNYYTFGSAVSEVEIDCLTGDHQVIRTDIVMDIGSSINPAIDIGQIEGAFMQGYGLFTLEELVYSPEGTLLSRGPGTYKIPGFSDIPGEFNVSLLTGAPNPRAVYSSKAIGEPPLFLASSVYFAIKEAIGAARIEENLDPHFLMQSPATAARIRMACEDNFVKKFNEPNYDDSHKPWNVMP